MVDLTSAPLDWCTACAFQQSRVIQPAAGERDACISIDTVAMQQQYRRLTEVASIEIIMAAAFLLANWGQLESGRLHSWNTVARSSPPQRAFHSIISSTLIPRWGCLTDLPSPLSLPLLAILCTCVPIFFSSYSPSSTNGGLCSAFFLCFPGGKVNFICGVCVCVYTCVAVWLCVTLGSRKCFLVATDLLHRWLWFCKLSMKSFVWKPKTLSTQ